MKLWEKGYQLNKMIESYTVGNDYILDKKLVPFDCQASIAHAKMLGKVGILQGGEVKKLVKELSNIVRLHKQGKFEIKREDEDCHTAIENYLTKKLGKLGGKIHTARSRNDQVLTALRLYYRQELNDYLALNFQLINAITKFIKKFGDIPIPGYTHTRKAMPSTVKLWAFSFVEAIYDNMSLINYILNLVDKCPLGSAAGYDIPIKVDKQFTAKLLNFKHIQHNPIYAQNSRGKYEATVLHLLTQTMYDFNKTANDLILFSMPEFGYFDLPVSFYTGSSIMPHKKNPDILELMRAKYHLVLSYEFQVKTIASNLISGYHRDLQLLKEAVFNGFEIAEQSVKIMTLIFNNLKVNKDNCQKAMTSELYSVAKVCDLVKDGVSFREAYRTVAKEYS